MLISRTILLSFRTLIDLALLSPLSYACYLTRPTHDAILRLRTCACVLSRSRSIALALFSPLSIRNLTLYRVCACSHSRSSLSRSLPRIGFGVVWGSVVWEGGGFWVCLRRFGCGFGGGFGVGLGGWGGVFGQGFGEVWGGLGWVPPPTPPCRTPPPPTHLFFSPAQFGVTIHTYRIYLARVDPA